MNTTAENLERDYKSFIDQTDNWNFFLGLAYYVDYILETPETKKVIDSIVKERLDEEKIIEQMGEELLKEMKPVKETLLKRIEEKHISYPELDFDIQEYEDSENGSAISNTPLPVALAESLTDIIWSLSQNGHKDLVKEFINERKGIVYYDKHEFYKKFTEYKKERQKHTDREKITLWGFWNYLGFAYSAVLKADEELARIKKDKTNFFTALGVSAYFNEMKRISKRDISDTTKFKLEDYKTYATRIHNYLMKELNKPPKSYFFDLSLENLIKIQKVIKIILDELELQDVNRLAGNKIPLKNFTSEGITYEDVVHIIKKINDWAGRDIIFLADKSAFLNIRDELRELTEMENELIGIKDLVFSKKDFEKNIIILSIDLDETRNIKNELDKKINKNAPNTIMDFDKEKSTLNINGTIIKIKKFRNQYYLLGIIFENKENMAKDWQFSEIAEIIDIAKADKWHTFYHVAYAIGNKIARETGIKDFFITTTQSIKINNKYLKL